MIVKNSAGFGLIETLVSLAIFLTISSAAYRQLQHILKFTSQLKESAERINSIERELSEAKLNLIRTGTSKGCRELTNSHLQLKTICNFPGDKASYEIKIYKN